MQIIQEKIITSDFGEKESEFFIYQPKKESNRVLFIIKGMYGIHRPVYDVTSEQKWDTQFVNYFANDINIVCLNTSHKKINNELDRDQRKTAYDGKTFQQESSDIQKIIKRVKDILHDQGVRELEFYFFGKSFGGTLLLDVEEILGAKAIFMVGSGCGKSDTTTKTLLITMPEERILLKKISIYNNGKFYFFRGERDTIVPKESQEKIVNAVNKDIREYIVLDGVDHEFEKINEVRSEIPLRYLLQKVSESIF
jgi:hypothetical protein